MHGRQTKSGPLFARRDVWLQQAVACVLWKSGTIVFDGNIDALVSVREHNSNLATHLSLFRHALDRLCSVLEQIAQRLTDQALEVCGQPRDTQGQINMGASSLATLTRLVAAGFGLTLMPEMAAISEQRAAPDMHLLRFAEPQPARMIGLVRRASSVDDGWFSDLAAILRQTGRELIQSTREIAA